MDPRHASEIWGVPRVTVGITAERRKRGCRLLYTQLDCFAFWKKKKRMESRHQTSASLDDCLDYQLINVDDDNDLKKSMFRAQLAVMMGLAKQIGYLGGTGM